MDTALHMIKVIDLVDLVRVGRQYGTFEDFDIPEDPNMLNDTIRSVSIELIRSLLPGSYVRRNDATLTVRLEGECFESVSAAEQAIHVHRYPSPLLAQALGNLSTVITSLNDSKLRNGQRYLYVQQDLDRLHGNGNLFSATLQPLIALAKALGEVTQCWEENKAGVDAFMESRRAAQKKLQDLQAQLERKKQEIAEASKPQNNLYKSLRSQLTAPTQASTGPSTMQSKLDASLAKKAADPNDGVAAAKWLRPGELVRVLKPHNGRGRNADWLAYPTEAELPIPPGYVVANISRVVSIGNFGEDIYVRCDGLQLGFKEEHWLPLVALYDGPSVKATNALCYKPDTGEFFVVHEGVETKCKTYEAACQFITENNLAIDVDDVRVHAGDFIGEKVEVIADVGQAAAG